MKTSALSLTVLFILFCNTLKPQNAIRDYGFRFGFNTMRTYTNNYDKNLYSRGYDLGFYYKKNLTPIIALSTELNFCSKKHARSSIETTSFIKTVDAFLMSFGNLLPDSTSISSLIESALGSNAAYLNDTVYNYYGDMSALRYFEIPLIFTYSFGKFSFETGPSISFLTGATNRFYQKQRIPLLDMLPTNLFDTLDYGDIINSTIYSLFPAYKDTVFGNETSTDNFSGFSTGIMAGLAYKLNDNWSFHMRYSHSFGNIFKDTEIKAKHNVFNFSLRYSIGHLFRQKAKFE